MQRFTLSLAIAVFLFLHTGIAKNNSSPAVKKEYRPGVVIVKVKESRSGGFQKTISSAAVSALQSTYQLSSPKNLFQTAALKKKNGIEELERVFTFRADSPTDIELLAKKISQDPSVEYAEPDYLLDANFVPNDPLYANIYPLSIIKSDQAWDVQKGDSTVVIAIIDTGVDWDHPDLAAAIWNNKTEIPGNGIDDDGNGFIDDVRGWDFVESTSPGVYPGEDSVGEDNDPMDFNGHGTHCAGIAAGVTNNGVGIASIGGGCTIMPLRIGWTTSAGGGVGYTSTMSKAFVYAADNGADVASLSFGTSLVAAEGAAYAYKNGVVILNAAGNQNAEDVGANAALGAEPWALSVAATNSIDKKASYSSYGKEVDISAPGGDFGSGNNTGFLSTIVNPSPLYGGKLYEYFQGTSMATPLVAGLAGLIKSQHKDWTPAQIMFQITGTADNIDVLNPSFTGKLGYGRINALRAVTETPASPIPSLKVEFATMNDAVGGNNNGRMDPGENVQVIVTVKNNWGDATNVTGTLSTSNWAVSVTKNTSAYGTVRGISNLDSCERNNSADAFTISIDKAAIPAPVQFTFHLTADGGISLDYHFTFSIGSSVLFVDDDDGSTNIESYYTSAFHTLGVGFDVWDHSLQGTPSTVLLQNYKLVIWACEWAFPSLNESDRGVLSTYLDGGGNLFLSGQDIAWDLADPAGDEFTNSSGASKTFFENYLKAKYVADDAGTTSLVGAAGDSITGGLTFQRTQPMRASTEQYPDVVAANGGSVVSVVYGAGSHVNQGAAVLYSGSYKLVYFSFGGYESITDSTIRLTVMDRLLKWINGYSLTVDKLKDIEDTSAPYPVSASLSSKNTVLSIDLYWDTDGQFPFQKLTMTLNNGKYYAAIPAQSANTDVEYFVLVKTSGGYLPYTINSFHVGPDVVAPTAAFIDTIANSVKLSGPYAATATITDNIAVDTSSVMLHYSIGGGPEQTSQMHRSTGDTFTGSILPASPIPIGTIVTYYLTGKDKAAVPNSVRSPDGGTHSFVVGREIVDNFETVRPIWNLGSWGYAANIKRSGLYSMTDSPEGNYSAGANNTLELIPGYDVSAYASMLLQFYHRNSIHTSDTLFVEGTKDGTLWTVMKKITGASIGFAKESFVLKDVLGTPLTNVRFRFRMVTDAVNNADGIYIDDIELLSSSLLAAEEMPPHHLPADFALFQNYPNPFNPSTTIGYSVPEQSHVRIEVFTILGQKIATLVDAEQGAKMYEIQWNPRVASGLYLYRIYAESIGNPAKKFVQTKMMVLLK
ncbi:MAG: S8 family serine peptidase [Bacteroidota bacterium]